MPVVTVVLPAFNEAESLATVIDRVYAALSGTSLEIIVVDDGSTDDTRGVIASLAESRPRLRYLRFSRNFGKEAAITAGLRAATGDAVIVMDSDGQHPPRLLPHFLERWKAGVQVVAGVQRARQDPPVSRALKGLYYWLLEGGSSIRIPRNAGDFRLMDRRVVDAINALPERNRMMKGLYAWVGFTTEFVAFDPEPRFAGTTKFSLVRLFQLGITGLTSFTTVPLRLVSLAGLLVSTLALIFGAYLLVEHFIVKDNLPGWATLSVGMMFLSGIQLLALGMIAEYLGRALEEAKQRPVYIIAEDIGSAPAVRVPADAHNAAVSPVHAIPAHPEDLHIGPKDSNVSPSEASH